MRIGRRQVAVGQGLFYVAGGAWPVVHLRSFEAVTGRKRDGWLVKTVGLLLVAIGTAEILAALRREGPERETRALGIGSAAALGAIDVIYSARRRISPVYLLDAAAQAAAIAAWKLARPERADAPTDEAGSSVAATG